MRNWKWGRRMRVAKNMFVKLIIHSLYYIYICIHSMISMWLILTPYILIIYSVSLHILVWYYYICIPFIYINIYSIFLLVGSPCSASESPFFTVTFQPRMYANSAEHYVPSLMFPLDQPSFQSRWQPTSKDSQVIPMFLVKYMLFRAISAAKTWLPMELFTNV